MKLTNENMAEAVKALNAIIYNLFPHETPPLETNFSLT